MSNQSMVRARKAFKDWRSQRENCKAPTPDNLRKMAVALCEQEGEELVRKKLGLSSSQIWEWKRERGNPRRLVGPRLRSRSTKTCYTGDEQSPKFVDVTPKNSQHNQGSISVEWSRADGSKMKLTGLGVQDTAVLAAQFLSQGVSQDHQP
jgi:hypothetical protein